MRYTFLMSHDNPPIRSHHAPSEHDPKQKQEVLRERFLRGEMSVEVLRSEIFKLDQQGDHTEQADANIQLLEDPDVAKRILAHTSSEVVRVYHRMLSISYFHRGQRNTSAEDFAKAHIHAMENQEDESYRFWVAYTRGTDAYFKRDETALERAVADSAAGRNREILVNLLASLKAGDSPESSYRRVYALP